MPNGRGDGRLAAVVLVSVVGQRPQPLVRRAAVGAAAVAARTERCPMRGAEPHAARRMRGGATLGADACRADHSEGPRAGARARATSGPERACGPAARRAARPVAGARARRAQTLRCALVRAFLRDAPAGADAAAARGVRDRAARDAADGRALLPARPHRRPHRSAARRPHVHQPYARVDVDVYVCV